MATILITGANKGIGLELARRYAARGDTVLACCRDPGKSAALKAIARGVEVLGVRIDDAQSVAALKETLTGRAIDVVINNAGMAGPAPDQQSAATMDYEGWAKTFAVNTMAPLRILQALRDNLRAGRQPKAVAITSQMGALDLNWPVMYAYCSSKAALNKVMRMLSKDFEKDGIAVAVVHPGHVKTDMGGPNAAITVEESAAGIIAVTDNLSMAATGSFVKWNGDPHNW